MGAGKLFVAPGEKMVLVTPWGDAVFAWRLARYRGDGQAGVNCSIFRNESPHLSSLMIGEAEQLAWRRWPGERLFTMVDPARVPGTNPGYCFKVAGWTRCGRTVSGQLIFERLP